MENRVPTPGQEGRVLITPENGSPYYAKIEMADNPTQAGTPLNKGTLLQDATCDVLAISYDSVPNDAFLTLALGTGKYGYVVTVLLPDGSPASGIVITGAETPSGASSATTNDDGVAILVSTSQTISIVLESPYIDILGTSVSIQSTGKLTNITVTLEESGELTIYSTTSKKTSPYLDTFDLCGVGAGGGGGGFSGTNASIATNKPGGGGGYVENLLAVSCIANSVITFSIGAGGVAGGASQAGGTGGKTTVSYNGSTILEANGGNGGGIQIASGNPASGGIGNGNGGSGSNNTGLGTTGGAGTGFKYNDQSLGIAGGGGGGGGRASGGAPNGADGSNYPNTSGPGTPGIGGGGGGGNNGGIGYLSGSGGNGVVYFRPHYKE